MENEKHPTQQENKCYPNMPAFASEHSFGLTKREYFAAMAMQGISANVKEHALNYYENTGDNFFDISKRSLELADKLIEHLNK